MQIECTTAAAAAQVVLILINAHLRPGMEFRVAGPRLPDPPILFSFHMHPLPHVVRQFKAVADAIITGDTV